MRLSPWQTLQSKITKKAGGLATLMCLALACSLVGYFYAHPIGLITSDLGRHISNGAVILAHGEPIRTKFYSYTQPTFSAVTHHWLAGVVYFWIWKLWGFSGLSVVNIGIGVLITGLVVMPSIKSSSRWTTLILSGLMIPLLTSRTEVRPEQWSYLFLVTTLWLGTKSIQTQSLKWLYPLPIIIAVWVNTHVFFSLGLGVAVVFLVQHWKSHRHRQKIGFLAVLCLGVTLINPEGLKGALTPFTLFSNYGFKVAENQTVWFMLHRSDFGFYAYSWAALSLIVMAVGIKWILAKMEISDWMVLGFVSLGFFYVRAIVMVPIVAMPLLANWIEKSRLKWVMASLLAGLLLLTPGVFKKTWPNGLGVPQNQFNSLAFFTQTGLKGPILNDYDNGGFLIFGLFPKERVFVDNRPEAYSTSFFNQLYMPLLGSEEAFKKADDIFKFNVIFFYRHDQTDNAQSFLYRRSQDPNWVPIYVDPYMLMLVKNTQENQAVISKFALDRQIFQMK